MLTSKARMRATEQEPDTSASPPLQTDNNHTADAEIILVTDAEIKRTHCVNCEQTLFAQHLQVLQISDTEIQMMGQKTPLTGGPHINLHLLKLFQSVQKRKN